MYGLLHLLRFRLEAVELIPLREVYDQVLTWTRPNFFELRYELLCSVGGLQGVVARVSINGMGDSKHALAETAEGGWKFQVFPFASQNVLITRAEDHSEVGHYVRQTPLEICFVGGVCYQLNHTKLEDREGRPVLSFDQLEAFPRWKAELKLAPSAIEISELPVLVASTCCIHVFR
jgi:hypothetical protein